MTTGLKPLGQAARLCRMISCLSFLSLSNMMKRRAVCFFSPSAQKTMSISVLIFLVFWSLFCDCILVPEDTEASSPQQSEQPQARVTCRTGGSTSAFLDCGHLDFRTNTSLKSCTGLHWIQTGGCRYSTVRSSIEVCSAVVLSTMVWRELIEVQYCELCCISQCDEVHNTVVSGPIWAHMDNILKSFILTTQCFYVVLMAYIYQEITFISLPTFKTISESQF